MAYLPRSQYELGDEEEIRRAEAHDHARAGERGDRLQLMTTAIVSALTARGVLSQVDAAYVVVFHILADHLYGNCAIDMPRTSATTKEPSHHE